MSGTTIVTNNGDVLAVDSKGGRITLTLGNIPVLTSITRGDGKVGNTHPCTPVFGPDRKNLFNLSQHGDMRNQECQLEVKGRESLVTYQITDGTYPKGMVVTQQMKLLENLFSFSMTHTNTGTLPAPVNSGEHCYFDAPQGFVGTMVNGIDVTEIIKANVNGATVELKESNTIQIPGKPELILKQQGFAKAMLWVGRHPETGVQDNNYVCIEPVEGEPTDDFFGSVASIISSGATRTARFSLQLKL